MDGTEEHECTYKDIILGMNKDVKEIKTALLGTYEKRGIVTEVKENTEGRGAVKKFNIGVVVAMVFAWIKIVFFK